MRSSFFLAISFLILSCNSDKDKFDIQDFGAKGDSLTVNTRAIQMAIDECSKQGGGLVLISSGIYISGTVILKDNVTLQIAENAKLVGSSNPQDYRSIDTFIDATGQARGTCLIGSINATNIGINGKGIIDGNGKAFLRKNLDLKRKELGIAANSKDFGSNRPFLLRFVGSSNIELSGITIREAAAWACHFYQSKDILVDNLTIYNHANKNNDGIDLDSSHDVLIKNCNINSGDDAICIKSTSPMPTYNIKVESCKLKSDWGAIKFGTESMGDFYNIDISNCQIYDTKGGGIKILSVDGANIHDISIDNIQMLNVDMPIFIRLGERLRTYRDANIRNVGSIKNIHITDVIASSRRPEESRVEAPTGIFITGTPDHSIESISLERISISMIGAGNEVQIDAVEEMVKAYPEFSFFKVLPAYGIYGRHIEELHLRDVEIKLEKEDNRKERIFEEVKKIKNL